MDTAPEAVKFRKTLAQHGTDVAKLFGTLMISFFTISGQLRSMIREEMEPMKKEFTAQITDTFNELSLRLDSLQAGQDTIQDGLTDRYTKPAPPSAKKRRRTR